MYSKLIPIWKTAGVLEWCDQLPTTLASTYAFLQTGSAASGKPAAGIDAAVSRQPGLNAFLKHLEVSHCFRHRPPLPEQGLAAILPSGAETEASNEDEGDSPSLILTVVCGLPGSYKEQLCTCLTRLVKDETRWMVLRPPNLEALENLRERLAGAVMSAPRRPVPGQSRKMLRGLLCCPGFVGPSHVAGLVEGLKTVRIGAVTVCVDTASAFIEHKLTMPMLLDQCANGWANNIIFTTEGSPDLTNAEDLQALLRCLSPKVTTIHAAKGEVSLAQEIDAILSENAFDDGDLRRARMLGRHGLAYPPSISCIPPALKEHHIQFDRPLSRTALMKVLKNMKSTLVPWPYVGNIYFVHGKVTFPQGAGRMLEFWHSAQSNATWTQNLEPLPAPPGAPPAQRRSGVTFIGCRLETDRLKEWLRQAAPPVPVRKTLRARADITDAELEKIHKEKHLSALPNGWFYNGIQYMTIDGTKSDRHPDFERHVEDFLSEANDAIRKHNKHIDTLDYHDLFESA